MTPRKAAVLASQLPDGAQVWKAADTPRAWTTEAHLTAAAIDVAQAGNWQRGGDSKAKRPKPIPRPGDGRRDDVRADRNEARARAFLERQRAREAFTDTEET